MYAETFASYQISSQKILFIKLMKHALHIFTRSLVHKMLKH